MMKITVVSAWYWVSTVQVGDQMKFCVIPLLVCSVYFKIQVKVLYVGARFKQHQQVLTFIGDQDIVKVCKDKDVM